MRSPLSRPRRRARLAAGCCLTAAAALAAGCSSSSADSGGTAGGGTLTIAAGAPSQTQDPTDAASNGLYAFATYDPLIYQSASGTYEPDLATSWGYVGTGNTTFQVTLRHGVKFSDGSPMTASAVAASLNRYIKATHYLNTGPVKDITTSGTDKVQIHYSTPVPYAFAVWSLSPAAGFGWIVGPYGVAHPTWLANHTDGVGPYVLDSAGSTSGGTQVYLPNKRYFNQAAIKYRKVVITPITSSSAQLAAVQSGQVQVDDNLPAADLTTAKSAGLQVATKPGGYTADLDLEKTTSGPLASLKVRQAIAYALPRSQILNDVFGGAGTATSSTSQPDYPGYYAADNNLYVTNLATARKLMAEAGYPHGFTLTALSGFYTPSVFAQAIAVALQKINITMNITQNNTSQFVDAAQSKKYEALALEVPAESVYTTVKSNLAPGALVNVWGATDAGLNAAMTAAETGRTPAAQETALQKVTATLDRLLWIVPIANTSEYAAVTSSVHNAPATIKSQLIGIDPFSPVASQAWYGG